MWEDACHPLFELAPRLLDDGVDFWDVFAWVVDVYDKDNDKFPGAA